ncbi:beta-D-glucosyl crocetin beta-1,6-glucosyltransferase-like [Pyrus x bretschneideri]|uniref:beta-D-glucosyl crocetin beta-1,6-glucosyltransferase-like n=1 Tax=Pyrus x bretschneideri TaxID=225117 RepID=UPI00202E42A5|nr:beta-D-glucosyl crocetin beta-1,6-glucosyltransferase-like [Pyrus x bretschneideri]
MDSRHGNSIMSVVMLPWLAHGHISPFFELAKKLSERNFHIFFCSTPVILNSVKPKLPERYNHCIEFVELHLPHDVFPELAPHYHTTNGLPPHLMPTLKKALQMASPYFSNILKTLNPDFLIYDFVVPWALSLGLDQNIPTIQFFIFSAVSVSFLFHRLFKGPSVRFPFPAIYLRDYEISKFNSMMPPASSNDNRKDDRVPPLQSPITTGRSCDLILLKTFREIEGKYVDYLYELMDSKILLLGPLLHDPTKDQEDKDEETDHIIKWLNKRETSSVVYISFGSEYFLSKEEIEEIAHGLELSKVSFIWVVRFPMEEKITRAEEVLLKGFVERVGERGMIVEGWASQTKILQNSSVGGFLSHCGWSSVLESMKFGVPIIAMPMHLDQPYNARLVEELGVGVEVKKTGRGGGLQREEVAKVIKDVMENNIGEVVRRKAMELRDNIGKREDREIEGLVDELVQLRIRTGKESIN